MDEVIKTNELPQVDALQDEDRVLVDTGAGCLTGPWWSR